MDLLKLNPLNLAHILTVFIGLSSAITVSPTIDENTYHSENITNIVEINQVDSLPASQMQIIEITKNKHFVVPIVRHVGVPVPQPYAVEIPKHIPVPVPQPYAVEVAKPVPVIVPRPYAVRVPVAQPVPFLRYLPVAVPRPYPVKVREEVPIPIPQPYAVQIPDGQQQHPLNQGGQEKPSQDIKSEYEVFGRIQ